MHGEGVRHPTTSVQRRLPLSKCSWFVWPCKILVLVRYKCLEVVRLMHAFRCDRFCYHSFPFDYLVSFRVLSETMAGCTWNPNIVHQNKVWFVWPWSRPHLPLGYKGLVVCHMTAWINPFILGLLSLFIRYPNASEFLIHVCTC